MNFLQSRVAAWILICSLRRSGEFTLFCTFTEIFKGDWFVKKKQEVRVLSYTNSRVCKERTKEGGGIIQILFTRKLINIVQKNPKQTKTKLKSIMALVKVVSLCFSY